MEKTIKILILEHEYNNIGLLENELKKSGMNFCSQIVQTRVEYKNALNRFHPDIILADYALPYFDGLAAFRIRQHVAPETPFIIVSGTIGEENAVELIRMGVTDYVLKGNLYQITAKIHWALNESTGRKQKVVAEQQLKQREQQLRKIMDLSLDVICTLDQEGRFVTLGAASKAVWGYSPEELIGTRSIDLVHEADKERTWQAIADLRTGLDMVNFENRIIRKEGQPVNIFWSVRWDQVEQLGYCIARDATEIKKAAKKLQDKEKRFRTLVQNSTDGYTLVRPDGTVLERSASALKILELDEQETSGNFRFDLVHPEDLSKVKEAWRQITHKPQEILTIEYRFLVADGSYKWVESTYHNQLQEPTVRAIVLNFRDITERKLAEIAVEKSEEKYRNLFKLSPSPMWVYDVENLNFLDVNQAAIKHYGFSKEEFLAMTLKDIRPREEVRKLEEIASTLQGSKVHFHIITRHLKKSGEIITVEIKNSYMDLGGRETRLVMATDIGEQVKYIQAIEAQNIKLREVAWMQSHVVRAPLARMMGLINLLKDYPPEKIMTTDLLSFLSTSAHELDDIIRDIVNKTEQVKGPQN